MKHDVFISYSSQDKVIADEHKHQVIKNGY